MGIHKTASGFRSEGLEKRQLLPAVKETRSGTEGNTLVGKKARNLCSCCSSSDNPAKRGLCTVTALWQAGEEERAARKSTAIQQDVFIAKLSLVTRKKGRGVRYRKEQSER